MSRCLYLLGPLALLSLSIPLAFLAVITTTLAFSTLLLRVSIIYFELGIALIHSWLFVDSRPVQLSRTPLKQSSSLEPGSQRRHRRRNSSSLAVNAVAPPPRLPKKSESFASLVGGNPTRDFEGVGGWSLARDGQDEEIWLMNSRLQLPTPSGENRRRHQRSLTGGSLRLARNPESARTSPVDSRNRTPSVIEGTPSSEGYFNIKGNDGRILVPEESIVRKRLNERQRIINSSAATSPGITRTSRL